MRKNKKNKYGCESKRNYKDFSKKISKLNIEIGNKL